MRQVPRYEKVLEKGVYLDVKKIALQWVREGVAKSLKEDVGRLQDHYHVIMHSGT